MLTSPSVNRSMCVLVIDDSPVDQRLISAILTRGGHRPICASRCTEGLALLEDNSNAIDLVLLDRMMPDINGVEAARLIRDLEKRHDDVWRPIVFLSGRHNDEDIAEGVNAGGDDYLAKPVSSDLLMAKLQAMQRIVQMRQQLLEMQRILRHEANTDALTGIANRRSFLNRLEQEVSRARRHGNSLCLAYLDLDHFKRINDRFGHPVGDAVLKGASQLLSRSVRNEDFIGRLGGEEFCICMPQSSIEQALHGCERYSALLEKTPLDDCPATLRVTVSVGLTVFDPLTDSSETLLSRADDALYRAKSEGRNRSAVIPPASNRSTGHVQSHAAH